MLSKSADPSLATPSQAPRGEGVEAGWEPPDRVRAKVKAQSRPRTLGRGERRRKPKWYGIRRVLVRAQEMRLAATAVEAVEHHRWFGGVALHRASHRGGPVRLHDRHVTTSRSQYVLS